MAALRRWVSSNESPPRERGGFWSMTVTERLTDGVRAALAAAGLPTAEDCAWEVPRQPEHGDYATNVAMTLARAAKRPPRQIADALAKHFPAMPEVARVEVAGPGFLNVFLAPAWTAGALHDILQAGADYGRGSGHAGQRWRLEFVSANPTGPLVIVNARAAAVGDALARLLRSQGARVTTEFYVNDAGTQFEALARSFEARVRQAFGHEAALPEKGYPGEYLIDLAAEYRAEGGRLDVPGNASARLQHFGRWAVERMVAQQRRMRAAMAALGHPLDAFQALIIQLVTLLRDGQPVRMSKRRGEFVLMEELLEEVGRDAARFTFLTRRHDSPLEFDLAVATRQSSDNPVYYVQYAHARIRSIYRQAAEQGIAIPAWRDVDLTLLGAPEEQALIKRLLEYPNLVAGAARALEPHRIAYWLTELAGAFHPYYKNHRVLQDDRRLMFARLALCSAVGQVITNGLALLGVSAPETM